jgi:hypothetical protein
MATHGQWVKDGFNAVAHTVKARAEALYRERLIKA